MVAGKATSGTAPVKAMVCKSVQTIASYKLLEFARIHSVLELILLGRTSDRCLKFSASTRGNDLRGEFRGFRFQEESNNEVSASGVLGYRVTGPGSRDGVCRPFGRAGCSGCADRGRRWFGVGVGEP